MSNERLHAYISGWVQGVGFRWWTIQTARKIGSITGWVRNLPDGRVELIAEGDRGKLDDLVLRLYQGPSSSKVNEVKSEWSKATGEFGGFDVRY